MSVRFLPLAALLAAAATVTLSAQPRPIEKAPAKYSMPKEYRAVQQSALNAQRKLMLSFADSMPENLYRDRATPAQRSFVEQVHHIVVAEAGLTGRFIAEQAPPPADTAAIFGSRAGLKKYITDVYDFLDKVMATQPDAERDSQVKFFGTFIPKWQVWDELNQHTMWTAGQVVANFRKHGMAPPSFQFFF